jgi:hypothetical protein
LDITCEAGVIEPPKHRLEVTELNPTAAASQSVG